MKKINLSLIKDFIISILLVFCIALVLSIIFYDKISISKVIPQSEEYMLSSEMQEELNKSYTDEDKEIVTTYYIDSADLKKYESTKEYNKGKKNPFAVENDGSSNNNGTTENGNNAITNNDTSSDTDSNRFYKDDGTK